MHVAIENKVQLEILEALLHAGYNFNKDKGHLCLAVSHGNYPHIKYLIQVCESQEELNSARVEAIAIGNLPLVQMLEKARSSTEQLKKAIHMKRCDILVYLLTEKPQIKPYKFDPVLFCVERCYQESAKVAAYPFCRWEQMLMNQKTYDIHKSYQDIIDILISHSVPFDWSVLNGGAPYTAACQLGLICVLLKLLRAGAGLSSWRAADIRSYYNCLTISISTDFRPSGVKRRNIRVAYILTEYITCFRDRFKIRSLLQKYHDAPGDIFSDLCDVMQELKEMLVENLTNPSCLQKLCRTVILRRLKDCCSVNRLDSLGTPSRITGFLLLKDLEELDREVCMKMGRLPSREDPKLLTCACIPF